MDPNCGPAAQVYDHTRAAIDCLAFTGHPLLDPMLYGFALLGLGLALRGGMLMVAARQAHAAAVSRFYPHARR